MLSIFTIGKNTHHLTVFKTSSYMPFNDAGVFLKISPNQSDIFPLDSMIVKLLSQFCLRQFIFTHEQNTRSIFVDAVSQNGCDIRILGSFVLQMKFQCVEQGSCKISIGRMHYHTGSFIYHNDVVILIHNIDWNIFWYYFC